jgi:cytochrome c oxidase subunit 2
VIDRSTRLAVTGLLAAGLAVTAAAGLAGTTAAPAPTTPAGARLFVAKGCATCHNGPESSARFPVGPDLGAVDLVAGGRVEGLDGPAYVRQSIRSPQAFLVAGFEQQMPTLAVSDEELDALVRYLLG